MSTRAQQQAEKAAALAEKAKARAAARSGKAPAEPETPADVVTPEDRQRHLSPAASTAPKVKPVRSTLDLPPVRYQQMKTWCGETAVMLGRTRVTTQDLLETLVARLLTDESLAVKIREDLVRKAQ